MRIKVNEVVNNSKIAVSFSCELGYAKVLWNGNVPENDEEYFVELDVIDQLVWGKNIKEIKANKCAIGIEGSFVIIVGQLETVEDNGYCVLRLEESIVSLEVKGTPPPQGKFVKIVTNEIVLHDVNY